MVMLVQFGHQFFYPFGYHSNASEFGVHTYGKRSPQMNCLIQEIQ